ncbi:hypothetical protein ACFLZH_02675 [Patescibacteria group bacterium]
MDIKEKLRPVYQELNGLYSSSPTPDKQTTISDSPFWEYYHSIIDEIEEITGEKYDKYRMSVNRTDYPGGDFIHVITYHQKLSGLISRLYGKFFSTELNPLTSEPSTQTTINQIQSQSQNIVIDFKQTVEEKIPKTTDSNEKNFLTTLKDKLTGIKNVTHLIKTIISTARDFGIGLEQMINLFS